MSTTGLAATKGDQTWRYTNQEPDDLVVACFTIDRTARASWNDVILGIIVFLLAAGSAEASSRLLSRRRRTLNP